MRRSNLLMKGFILSLLISPAIEAATAEEIGKAIRTLYGESHPSIPTYSDMQLKNLLRREGYEAVRIIERNQIRFKMADTIYVLYLHNDGDLHLYFGATGYKLNYKDVNEWNRTTRLSRAYIDEEGDIALETDLLANAGLNQHMIIETVNVFIQTSVPRFVKFAAQRNQQ